MPRTLVFIIIALSLVLTACGQPGASDSQSNTSNLPPVPIQILHFWETKTGNLDESADVEVWQFVGAANETIQLRVVEKGITVTMVLQDAGGTVLAQGTDITQTLPADGVYSVIVRLLTTGSGSYDIGLAREEAGAGTATPLPEIVGVPTPTPAYANLGAFQSTIDDGQTIQAILDDTSPLHVYTFEGQTGGFIQAEMERVGGTIDPVLTIYSPSGNPLAMDDNSGGGRTALLRSIRLPEDGVYSLQASGDGLTGEYRLTLTRGNAPFPATPSAVVAVTPTNIPTFVPPTIGPAVRGSRLDDHVPVIGRLNDPANFDQYSIFAAAGETITLGVSPIGEQRLSALVEIYDPQSNLVTSARSSTSNANGDAFIPPLTMPETGAYLVFVSSEDGSTGNYVIAYGTGMTRQDRFRGEADSGVRIEGEITSPGVRDVWQVYLNAGDVITAAVTPTSSPFDPLLEIALDDGTLIATDDNGGGGRAAILQSVPITSSGVYKIRVRDAAGLETGSYTLLWRYINLAPTPTPIPNALTILSVDGELPDSTTNPDDAYQFYVFQGEAREIVRISVIARPGSELDAVAVLLGPNGQPIAESDDTEGDLNPRFVVELPENGTYTVRIVGYLSGGPFDLTVDRLFR